MSIWSAIPLKWKVIGVVVGLLTYTAIIGGSIVYIYSQGKEHGVKTERLAQGKAENEALTKAIEERDQAYAQLQEIEDEIFNQPPADDAPLSNGLARTLDRVW